MLSTTAVLVSVLAAAGTQGLDRVARASTALEALELGESEEVPRKARPLLTMMKHGLRDMILGALSSSPAETRNASEIRAHVLEGLAQRKILGAAPETRPGGTYGRVLDVAVAFPEGLADHAAATTTVSIPCGSSDTSFYLFRRSTDTWKVVATQEAYDYKTILGAQGQFEYLVLNPTDTRGLYVVTGNKNEWCSSCWHNLRLRVMRIGSSPGQSPVILKEEYFFYACGGYTLGPAGAGFEVTFTDDFDAPNRRIRFAPQGGRFVEVGQKE